MKKIFFGCLFLLFISSLNAQTAQDSLVTIETIDDQSYFGKIVEQTDKTIVIETISQGQITLQKWAIKRIRYANKPIKSDNNSTAEWFENPHPNQYILAPTGYGLGRGKLYFDVTSLQMNYGVSDYFTIGGGLFPAIILQVPDVPFWLSAKVSIPVKENAVNFGFGGFYFNIIGEDELDGGVGVVYGAATFGDKNKNITFSFGNGFDSGQSTETPTASIGGTIRIRKKVYLSSENYFVFEQDNFFALISAGGRLSTEKINFDFGVFSLILQDADIPIFLPFARFGFNFNSKARP